ncbi:MAG: hypothetical protein ACREYF_10355 [Gammaproteobacteria bacterium]
MPIPTSEVVVGGVYATSNNQERRITKIEAGKGHYESRGGNVKNDWSYGHAKASPLSLESFAEACDKVISVTKKGHPMSAFDAMFARLRKEPPSFELRWACADLVAQSLEQVRDSLDYWEKERIAYAIAALARSINNTQKPTSLWLHLALVSAEKALTPKEQRDEEYGRKEGAINALTYQKRPLSSSSSGHAHECQMLTSTRYEARSCQ